MKQIIILIAIFIQTILLAQSQIPQGFTYQAVALGSDGAELVNQNVSIRASILSGSASGDTQWIEMHQPQTDEFGLFTLIIGQGTPGLGGLQSNFSDIDWGSSSHFIKIEMDVNAGTDYQLLGVSQLMSVPYALYAESSYNTVNSDVATFGDYTEIAPNIDSSATYHNLKYSYQASQAGFLQIFYGLSGLGNDNYSLMRSVFIECSIDNTTSGSYSLSQNDEIIYMSKVNDMDLFGDYQQTDLIPIKQGYYYNIWVGHGIIMNKVQFIPLN